MYCTRFMQWLLLRGDSFGAVVGHARHGGTVRVLFWGGGDGKKQLQNMDWEWMEEDKKEERRKERSKKLNDTSEVNGSTTAD